MDVMSGMSETGEALTRLTRVRLLEDALGGSVVAVSADNFGFWQSLCLSLLGQ